MSQAYSGLVTELSLGHLFDKSLSKLMAFLACGLKWANRYEKHCMLVGQISKLDIGDVLQKQSQLLIITHTYHW